MRAGWTIGAMMIAWGVGCGAGAPQSDSAVESVASKGEALEIGNGTQMNGTQMNGTQMNGTQMNGTVVNGTDLGEAGRIAAIHYVKLAGATAEVTSIPVLTKGLRTQTADFGGIGGIGDIGIGDIGGVTTQVPASVTLDGGALIATYASGGRTVTRAGGAFTAMYLRGVGPRVINVPPILTQGGATKRTLLAGAAAAPTTASALDGRLGGATDVGTVLLADPNTLDGYVALRQELTAISPALMQEYSLHVKGATPIGPKLVRYDVDVQTPAGDWVPLCREKDGQTPTYALAVAGRWNYQEGVPGGGAKIDDASAFTFACHGSAIAKCLEVMGYVPWETTQTRNATTAPMEPLHEACVRMVRADYCGNGISLTRTGTVIDVADSADVQHVSEPQWATEARWTSAGADCGESTRQLNVPTPAGENVNVLNYVHRVCPTAFEPKPGDFCAATQIIQGYSGPPNAPGDTTPHTNTKPTINNYYDLIYTTIPPRVITLPPGATDVGGVKIGARVP